MFVKTSINDEHGLLTAPMTALAGRLIGRRLSKFRCCAAGTEYWRNLRAHGALHKAPFLLLPAPFSHLATVAQTDLSDSRLLEKLIQSSVIFLELCREWQGRPRLRTRVKRAIPRKRNVSWTEQCPMVHAPGDILQLRGWKSTLTFPEVLTIEENMCRESASCAQEAHCWKDVCDCLRPVRPWLTIAKTNCTARRAIGGVRSDAL